ncbi:MAG TPA: DNA repair protein RadC [Spirochaetales bacterium]|nr:DNA repair protein RadC [Spirochaetales bacterium]
MSNDTLYDSARGAGGRQPRIRERLACEGPASLSDAELVAALIGTGTRGRGVRELAEEVVELLDSGRGAPEEAILRRIGGMGSAKACAVAAALELGRRLYGPRETKLASPRDVYPLVAHWADRKQERFICCSLNGAHELIAARVVSVGLVNRTVVHPREVYADPITDRACAVVVAHNHPSGRLEPSPEDREITLRLKEAGETLGLVLLDHLIFSREGFYSFVEHGLLEPPAPEA